jgi:hypothetical protein
VIQKNSSDVGPQAQSKQADIVAICLPLCGLGGRSCLPGTNCICFPTTLRFITLIAVCSQRRDGVASVEWYEVTLQLANTVELLHKPHAAPSRAGAMRGVRSPRQHIHIQNCQLSLGNGSLKGQNFLHDFPQFIQLADEYSHKQGSVTTAADRERDDRGSSSCTRKSVLLTPGCSSHLALYPDVSGLLPLGSVSACCLPHNTIYWQVQET